jgi:transcriptional regulator of acetoin/glycerol metabolism
VSQLSGEARDALLAYSWPGNIRELENVIERCVLLADDNTIRLRDLSTEVRSAAGSGAGAADVGRGRGRRRPQRGRRAQGPGEGAHTVRWSAT